jgi:hypothetical protein
LMNLLFLILVSLLSHVDRMPNKKAEHTKGIILRQLGRLGRLRPVTFRPPLTKGLALSWNHLFVQVAFNETFISILNTFQNVVPCKVEFCFKHNRSR